MPSAAHVGTLLPASSALVSDLLTDGRWLEYLGLALLGGGVNEKEVREEAAFRSEY